MAIQLTPFDTYGRNIVYSAGARRLAGAKIWALDLEQGDFTTGDPAIGSWAESFGYPLFPTEQIFLNRLWGDGQLMYVDPSGPNSAEAADIIEFTAELVYDIYYGTETQLACPTIVADKGANRTPAFRGQLYIVFRDVPLNAFGNRYPQVSAEFLRQDQQRIAVADVLERVGVLGGRTIECVNIDDMADGVVFESFNPRSIIEDYREQYNYRVIDGEPVRLVRRVVNEGLIVDWDLDPENDLVTVSADDEVTTLERREDSELPNQVEITFTEKQFEYQTATQYARRPRFPVPATESRDVISQRTDFIITAVEALTLAYGLLYQFWTRRLTAQFTVKPAFSEMQEGDVVRLPTPQGTYLFDVVARSLEPNQEVAIESDCLLAESGVEVTADSADAARKVARPCYYPQILQGGYRLIEEAGELWANSFCIEAGIQGLSVVYTNRIPTRITLANQVALLSTSDYCLGGDYVYAYGVSPGYTSQGQSGTWSVRRINRSDKVVEDIVVAPPIYASGEVQGGVSVSDCAIFDATLYFVEDAEHDEVFVDPIPATGIIARPLNLRRVPVEPFDGSLGEVIQLAPPPPITPYNSTINCIGVVAVDHYILASTVEWHDNFLNNGTYVEARIFRYDTINRTVASVLLDHPLGRGASGKNGSGYFMPYGLGTVHDPFGVHINMAARVEAATLTVEYFDTADDPFVYLANSGLPWVTAEHVCFFANNRQTVGEEPEGVPYYNAPYLARRLLSDVSQFDGFDLTEFFDYVTYTPHLGIADDTWHYIAGYATQPNFIEHGGGFLLQVSIDGLSALMRPFGQDPPTNDNFASPKELALDTTVSFYNEWATKEEGEPDHAGDPGGLSLWYSFTPTVDSYYQLHVGGSRVGFGGNFVFGVYEGNTLGNLNTIASGDTAGPDQGNLSFVGWAGLRYRIAVDGASFTHFGSNEPQPTVDNGTIEITSSGASGAVDNNDNFANAIIISAGQTKLGHNIFATKELYEPDHAGNPGGRSLWWKFTPADGHTYRISTAGSDFPTLLGVYTGTVVDDLTEVDSDDDGGHPSLEDAAAWLTVA